MKIESLPRESVDLNEEDNFLYHDEEGGETRLRSHLRTRTLWFLAVFRDKLPILLLAISITLGSFNVSLLPMTDVSHCGNSTEEARALGCIYERVTMSWVPPACYDATLDDEWNHFGNWSLFDDPSATIPLSVEQVKSGEYEMLYTDVEWHLSHCTYAWKKMHRAFSEKRPLDSPTWKYAHTEHCSRLLLAGLPRDRRSTTVEREFATCSSKTTFWRWVLGRLH